MRWQGEKYFDMARRLANSQRMGYGSAAFVPPTSGEVLQYARERKMPEQWAMDFYVHYRGVGWKCGKTAMADWKVISSIWASIVLLPKKWNILNMILLIFIGSSYKDLLSFLRNVK